MRVDLSGRGLRAFTPGDMAGSEAAADSGLVDTMLSVTNLDLSHNALGSLGGLRGLSYLTVLNLSSNGLTSIGSSSSGGGVLLLPLTLVLLNLSHNSITSLEDGALLPLHRLQSLDVSSNQLTDLRGVAAATGSPSLVLLDASDNQLSSAAGIERCLALEGLHVQRNLIREAADLATVRHLPRLRTLLLEGNPLLLRKRQLMALHALLPRGLALIDAPAPSAVASVNTSLASGASSSPSTTLLEVEVLRRNNDYHSSRNHTANTSGRFEGVGGHGPRTHSPTSSSPPPALLPSTQRRFTAPADRSTDAGGGVVGDGGAGYRVLTAPMPSPRARTATPNRSANTSGVSVGGGTSGGVGGRSPSPSSARRRPSPRRRGTSPEDGVGGATVSPSCPRRSLPGDNSSNTYNGGSVDRRVPPLQPYNITEAQRGRTVATASAAAVAAAIGHGSSSAGPLSAEGEGVRAAEAHMLRSSLYERVVGPPQQQQQQQESSSATVSFGTTVPSSHQQQQQQQGQRHASPGVPPTTQQQRGPGGTSGDPLSEEERDAHRRHAEALEAELSQLRQALMMERENTAVVLCINHQLQLRIQALVGGAGIHSRNNNGSAMSVNTSNASGGPLPGAAAAMPPLAPQPGAVRRTPQDVGLLLASDPPAQRRGSGGSEGPSVDATVEVEVSRDDSERASISVSVSDGGYGSGGGGGGGAHHGSTGRQEPGGDFLSSRSNGAAPTTTITTTVGARRPLHAAAASPQQAAMAARRKAATLMAKLRPATAAAARDGPVHQYQSQ